MMHERSSDPIVESLRRASYHLVQTIDLGTTARILVVEKDGQRHALKILRDRDANACAMRTEYRVLQHLSGTPMRAYVPRVGPWLHAFNGFLMAYLRYPTPAEKGDAAWMPNLARALRTLHTIEPPALLGLQDDRPDVVGAVARRFRALFHQVWRSDAFWAGLSEEDRPKLERVRPHHRTYVGLLPRIEEGLTHAPAALTHGDLAGDNVMLAHDGRPAIVDWGSARISAAWTDAASLAAYSEWSANERRRFYDLYLGGSGESQAEARQCLENLARLHRYRSCVQSLLWLNDESEGLDAVGRAYFERELAAL